jgi:hypothetical protein
MRSWSYLEAQGGTKLVSLSLQLTCRPFRTLSHDGLILVEFVGSKQPKTLLGIETYIAAPA